LDAHNQGNKGDTKGFCVSLMCLCHASLFNEGSTWQRTIKVRLLMDYLSLTIVVFCISWTIVLGSRPGLGLLCKYHRLIRMDWSFAVGYLLSFD
jgi:hypothetical protein